MICLLVVVVFGFGRLGLLLWRICFSVGLGNVMLDVLYLWDWEVGRKKKRTFFIPKVCHYQG